MSGLTGDFRNESADGIKKAAAYLASGKGERVKVTGPDGRHYSFRASSTGGKASEIEAKMNNICKLFQKNAAEGGSNKLSRISFSGKDQLSITFSGKAISIDLKKYGMSGTKKWDNAKIDKIFKNALKIANVVQPNRAFSGIQISNVQAYPGVFAGPQIPPALQRNLVAVNPNSQNQITRNRLPSQSSYVPAPHNATVKQPSNQQALSSSSSYARAPSILELSQRVMKLEANISNLFKSVTKLKADNRDLPQRVTKLKAAQIDKGAIMEIVISLLMAQLKELSEKNRPALTGRSPPALPQDVPLNVRVLTSIIKDPATPNPVTKGYNANHIYSYGSLSKPYNPFPAGHYEQPEQGSKFEPNLPGYGSLPAPKSENKPEINN